MSGNLDYVDEPVDDDSEHHRTYHPRLAGPYSLTLMTDHHTRRTVAEGLIKRSGFTEICHLGIGESGEWYTAGRVTYYDAKLDYYVSAPPWFINDLASIPRIVHPIIPKNGYHRLPAVVHDYLCVTAELPRAEADRIFREACYVAGVAHWKIAAMYSAVRAYSVTGGRRQNYNRLEAHPRRHLVDPRRLPAVNRRSWEILVEPSC